MPDDLASALAHWSRHALVKEGVAPDTERRSRRRIEMLIAECDWDSLDDITADSVRCWLTEAAESGRSPKTRRNYLASLNVFLDWCVSEKLIAANEVRSVKIREHGEGTGMRPLTIEQVRAVIHAARRREARRDHRNRAPASMIYATLWHTGMRVGELRSLEWGDVDLGRRLIRVRPERSKNRRERQVVIPDELARLLAAPSKAAMPHDFVFPVFPEYATLKRDIEAAGIDPSRVGWHSFRKGLLTHLHRQGLADSVIASQSGHRNLTTLANVYIDAEAKRETLRKAVGDNFVAGGQSPAAYSFTQPPNGDGFAGMTPRGFDLLGAGDAPFGQRPPYPQPQGDRGVDARSILAEIERLHALLREAQPRRRGQSADW